LPITAPAPAVGSADACDTARQEMHVDAEM
jgi:hypothetical protein